MEQLIQMAVCLIGGLMLSRVAKKCNLPAVTAYLVAGLLIGPFVLGRLGVPGLGFQTAQQVEALSLMTQVALGFISFTIGNEFRLEQLREMGHQAVTVGIVQAVFTTLLVDLGLVGLHFLSPSLITIASALTLGAIASATAPAATLMVVRQYKADGPLTKLLLLVVAIDDAVGLVLFSTSFGVAMALESEAVSPVSVIVEPMVEIVLSLALGALSGLALSCVERFFHSRSKRLSISVAFVLLSAGLSMVEFEIMGIHCGFSLLLVCMMTGTLFCNTCEFSQELMARIDSWTAPLFVLFFVLSGAELDLRVLRDPAILLIGAAYILLRSLGKYSGAFLGCRATHCEERVTRNLGITLLPQAGVALGMALTAQTLSGGATVRSVVLLSVLLYELIGPALTRRALIDAGEIHPEGRTNARRKNESVHKPGK